MERVFVLSPASCSGKRAGLVLRKEARFDLAVRLKSTSGAPLGEVFSFLSGLYFRAKLQYARAFARAPIGIEGAWVITANRGLRPAGEHVRASTLRSFARVPIRVEEPRYRRPLAKDARALAARIGAECEVVLLGSVATDKYIAILSEALGPRLRFPEEFAGRGDMSRGGLMLRSIDEGRELSYVPLDAVTRHRADVARPSYRQEGTPASSSSRGSGRMLESPHVPVPQEFLPRTRK